MFDAQLFLGAPLTQSYRLELDKLPSAERMVFIQSQASPYLQEIEWEGISYLGKVLGPAASMSDLDSSSSHILSLLKKLVPHFPHEEHKLMLLAISEESPIKNGKK